MMRQLFISVLFCALSAVAVAQGSASISSVELRGNWIYVFDANGKKLSTEFAANAGAVVGWSTSFWISKHGDWYYLWTPTGKKYKTLYDKNIGEIIGVSGNTFTARQNDWIYTYDKDGKKISSRYSSR